MGNYLHFIKILTKIGVFDNLLQVFIREVEMNSAFRLIAIFSFLICSSVFAKQSMDFELYNLGKGNYSDFDKVSKQFANVIAPMFAGEAETRGAEGFEIGLGYTLGNISTDKSYWENALNDTPTDSGTPTFYNGVDLHVKKGLPFGFGVHANIRYFPAVTEMLSGGFGFEYAVNEGFVYLPDFTVGFGYNRLFSSSDMNMSMYEVRARVGKTFPVAGEIKLSPYFMYSYLRTYASSDRLGGFYEIRSSDLDLNNDGKQDAFYDGDASGDSFRFEERAYNLHRVLLGFKVMRGYFAFSVEGGIPFDADGAFNVNSGLSFVF